jgi:hypothetical protein
MPPGLEELANCQFNLQLATIPWSQVPPDTAAKSLVAGFKTNDRGQRTIFYKRQMTTLEGIHS